MPSTIFRTKSLQKKFLQATLGIFCGSTFWGLMLNPAALATAFKTTLTFDNPTSNGETAWVFDWAGTDSNMDSMIDESELTYWSAQLLAGPSSVYSLVVVQDGVVQDIEGLQKSDVLFWEFDLSGNFVSNYGLRAFDYEIETEIEINNDDGGVNWLIQIEGNIVTSGFTFEQQATKSTPEPNLVIAFIALSGLILGSTRKAIS